MDTLSCEYICNNDNFTPDSVTRFVLEILQRSTLYPMGFLSFLIAVYLVSILFLLSQPYRYPPFITELSANYRKPLGVKSLITQSQSMVHLVVSTPWLVVKHRISQVPLCCSHHPFCVPQMMVQLSISQFKILQNACFQHLLLIYAITAVKVLRILLILEQFSTTQQRQMEGAILNALGWTALKLNMLQNVLGSMSMPLFCPTFLVPSSEELFSCFNR